MKVIKRDGTSVDYDRSKIVIAIEKANAEVPEAERIDREGIDAIIDGIEEESDMAEFIGHAWFQAPDSDGAVHIPEGEYAIGDVVPVKLVDAFCYELVGEPLDSSKESR